MVVRTPWSVRAMGAWAVMGDLRVEAPTGDRILAYRPDLQACHCDEKVGKCSFDTAIEMIGTCMEDLHGDSTSMLVNCIRHNSVQFNLVFGGHFGGTSRNEAHIVR